MKKSRIMNVTLKTETKKSAWKRRPSEIRGYQAAIYMNTESGDYLRVDYNLRERKIRVYLEDSEEGGNPYYAVITHGKITAQRNATSGRALDVTGKIRKRAALFATISNKEVKQTISTAFGLKQQKPEPEKNVAKNERIKETKRRYFKNEQASSLASQAGSLVSPTQRVFFELADIVTGGLLGSSAFLYFKSYIAAGIVLAVFGVATGVVDIFLRGRPPSFVKMLLLIITGMASYIYGYYIY